MVRCLHDFDMIFFFFFFFTIIGSKGRIAKENLSIEFRIYSSF